MFLHRAVKQKDEKMEALIKNLATMLSPFDLIKLHNNMQGPWQLEETSIGQINYHQMGQPDQSKLAQRGMIRQTSRQLVKRSSSSSKSRYFTGQKPSKFQKKSDQDTVSEKSINSIAANFEKSMISNFVTTQEELDQFKQNDEKDYEEMDIEIEK